jgi:hypothetical protein
MILLTKIQRMKKTSIRLVLAIAFSAMMFTACKKDKDDEPVGATKENLIGSYKLTELKLIVAGQPTDIYTTFVPACQRDDIYTLTADFKVQVKDEGTKCSPANTYESTWSLDGNYVEIDGYAGDVKSFDGKTLVIEGSGSQGGISGSISAKFVKQ